jgi:hypothetical protein
MGFNPYLRMVQEESEPEANPYVPFKEQATVTLPEDDLREGFNQRIVDSSQSAKDIADWIQASGYGRPDVGEIRKAAEWARQTANGRRTTSGFPRLQLRGPNGERATLNPAGMHDLQPQGNAKAFTLGFGKTATFEAGDEAAAGLSSALGGDYNQTHQNLSRMDDAAWEHNPVPYAAGRVLGAVPSIVAGRGLGFDNWLAQGSRAVQALKGGATGAGVGGFTGAAGSDPGNRAAGAAFGAAIGTPLGIAAPFIVPLAQRLAGQADEKLGIGRGINALHENFARLIGRTGDDVPTPALTPEQRGGIIAHGRRNRNDVESMRAQTEAMRSAGLEPNLASVSDGANTGQLASYARRSLPEREAVSRQSDAILEDMQGWVPSRVDAARADVPNPRHYSTNPNRPARAHELETQRPGPARNPDEVRGQYDPETNRMTGLRGMRDEEVSQAMRPIRDVQVPITDDLVNAVSSPDAMTAIRRAARMINDPEERAALLQFPRLVQQLQGLGPSARAQVLQGQGMTLDMADKVRRSLNKMAEGAEPAIAGNLRTYARAFRGAAEEGSPEYRGIMQRYGDQSRTIDAVETGERFMTGVGSQTDEFVRDANRLRDQPNTRTLPEDAPDPDIQFHVRRQSGGNNPGDLREASIDVTTPNGETADLRMHWRVGDQPHEAHADVSIYNESGSINAEDGGRMGAEMVRRVIPHIRQHFPEIGSVGGTRVTGTRGDHARTARRQGRPAGPPPRGGGDIDDASGWEPRTPPPPPRDGSGGAAASPYSGRSPVEATDGERHAYEQYRDRMRAGGMADEDAFHFDEFLDYHRSQGSSNRRAAEQLYDTYQQEQPEIGFETWLDRYAPDEPASVRRQAMAIEREIAMHSDPVQRSSLTAGDVFYMEDDVISDVMDNLAPDDYRSFRAWNQNYGGEYEDPVAAARSWLVSEDTSSPGFVARLFGDERGAKTIGGSAPQPTGQRYRDITGQGAYDDAERFAAVDQRTGVDRRASPRPDERRSMQEEPDVPPSIWADESGTKRLPGGFRSVGGEDEGSLGRLGRIRRGEPVEEAAPPPPPPSQPRQPREWAGRELPSNYALVDIAPRAQNLPSDRALAQESAVRATGQVAGQGPAAAIGAARRLGRNREQAQKTNALFGEEAGTRLGEEMELGLSHARRNARINPELGSPTSVNQSDDIVAAGQALGAIANAKSGGMLSAGMSWLRNAGVSDRDASAVLQVVTSGDPRALDEAIEILARYYGNREQARIAMQGLATILGGQAAGSQGAQAPY